MESRGSNDKIIADIHDFQHNLHDSDRHPKLGVAYLENVGWLSSRSRLVEEKAKRCRK